MKSRKAETKLAELRAAFEDSDVNNDGALNRKELMRFGLQMFGKKCPYDVYKGMCEYSSKTVEQGLDWKDIQRLFVESNDVNLKSKRRDPLRRTSPQNHGGFNKAESTKPPVHALDFSLPKSGHSRTQSLSS